VNRTVDVELGGPSLESYSRFGSLSGRLLRGGDHRPKFHEEAIENVRTSGLGSRVRLIETVPSIEARSTRASTTFAISWAACAPKAHLVGWEPRPDLRPRPSRPRSSSTTCGSLAGRQHTKSNTISLPRQEDLGVAPADESRRVWPNRLQAPGDEARGAVRPPMLSSIPETSRTAPAGIVAIGPAGRVKKGRGRDRRRRSARHRHGLHRQATLQALTTFAWAPLGGQTARAGIGTSSCDTASGFAKPERRLRESLQSKSRRSVIHQYVNSRRIYRWHGLIHTGVRN